MVKRLYCRVGVVLSISLAFVLASTSSLKAQFSNYQTTEVTLACKAVSLESALEKISKKAGVFFIYSSSLLDPAKTISFAAQNQPLSELLNKIGDELNLSFRYEGKYIILKKSEQIVRSPEVKVFSPVIASADLSANPLIGQPIPSRQFNYSGILSAVPHFSPVEIKTPELTPLKPLEIIAPKTLLYKQGFASAGLVANGYTNGGAELRGGIKPLYALVNFGFVDKGRYRVGYGLGTAAFVSDKFSFNLIYNFGNVLGRNDVVFIKENNHFLMEKNYTVRMKHNQLKLMLQYDFHPRFYASAGASLICCKRITSFKTYFVLLI